MLDQGFNAAQHDELQDLAHRHLLLHFATNGSYGPGARELPVLVSGSGVRVRDSRGREYFDGISSLFCAQLGYSYGSEFAEAARKQLQRLAYNTNYSTAHPPAIRLAAELATIAPAGLNRAFFVSGGSEAVESAWKIARQHHVLNGQGQRTKAIARRNSYHGVTLGALSFTGIPALASPFGEPAIPVRHVSDTNIFRTGHDLDERFTAKLLDEIESVIEQEGPETIAVVIAEPLQNVGGCLKPPPGYWPGLRSIADRHGILLHADEVISGFGRVGEWFAGDRYGAVPDIVTIAKGLSSAHAPIGAVLVSDRVAAPLLQPGVPLVHGLTYGGHPVCAAVALKNIEIFRRDGILENVCAVEPTLTSAAERLRRLDIVGDVRGDGFFWAAELVNESDDGRFDREDLPAIAAATNAAMLAAGLIVRVDTRAGVPIVQLAPPLVCTGEEVIELVGRVGEVLSSLGAESFTGQRRTRR